MNGAAGINVGAGLAAGAAAGAAVAGAVAGVAAGGGSNSSGPTTSQIQPCRQHLCPKSTQ